MTVKSRADIQTETNANIADNTAGDISAGDVRNLLINFTDSFLNLTTDSAKLGLKVYDTAQAYLVGDITVNGTSIYKCNTNTTGAFDVAKWDLLFTQSRTLKEYVTTESYLVGDCIVRSNALLQCITNATGAYDATKWKELHQAAVRMTSLKATPNLIVNAGDSGIATLTKALAAADIGQSVIEFLVIGKYTYTDAAPVFDLLLEGAVLCSVTLPISLPADTPFRIRGTVTIRNVNPVTLATVDVVAYLEGVAAGGAVVTDIDDDPAPPVDLTGGATFEIQTTIGGAGNQATISQAYVTIAKTQA
jgi:hypothetical protein